jgi:hypothetical protein
MQWISGSFQQAFLQTPCMRTSNCCAQRFSMTSNRSSGHTTPSLRHRWPLAACRSPPLKSQNPVSLSFFFLILFLFKLERSQTMAEAMEVDDNEAGE